MSGISAPQSLYRSGYFISSPEQYHVHYRILKVSAVASSSSVAVRSKKNTKGKTPLQLPYGMACGRGR